jgi:hypothetical protein
MLAVPWECGTLELSADEAFFPLKGRASKVQPHTDLASPVAGILCGLHD